MRVDNMVWIVDKQDPNIPIFKISQSDFNLIRNGIYKSQGNKIEFSGKTYWLPTDLSNKLKVKLKLNNVGLGNIGISMQEFLNKEILDNIEFKVFLENILHLKNKNEDIYIICSKQVKKNYDNIIKKLEKRIIEEGLSIKNFYFLSETFYNQNDDDIRYTKIKLLIQHLIGYKTKVNKFTDEELQKYDNVHFYDNQYDTLKICDEINIVLKSILNKTEDGLRSVIKEDLLEYKPSLIVNKISDNEMNKKSTKMVDIEYSNLFKTFESFRFFENNSANAQDISEFIKNYIIYDFDDNDEYHQSRLKSIESSIENNKEMKSNIVKWLGVLEDIDYILLDISDRVKSENVTKHYTSFKHYKGVVNIDCIEVKTYSGEDNIKENYIKGLFKVYPLLTIQDMEYSNRIDDDRTTYTTRFRIFFKSDLSRKH